jgi:psp operon transcriptional activator
VKNTNASFPLATADASGVQPIEAFGKSDRFLDFQQSLARAARVQRPVLLIGERGTGKELAAARVHYLSPRWGGPFIKLNCAALAPSVLESELFGHEAGAFTGATRRRVGRFEAANGGTLFLDEIGQMPLMVQEKILRVVEYGTFERVGASEPVSVDVRLVGATNADLPALAEEGKFKRDLLDRLSFEVLALPALRERGAGDIDLLTRNFAARMASELGFRAVPEFSARAREALLTYPWPGNVRELKNVVERAVARAEDSGTIEEIVFDPFQPLANGSRGVPPAARAGTAAPPNDALPTDFQAAIAEVEIRLLRRALVNARYRQREAAQALGLSYDQFRGLYRKYARELAESPLPAAS